MTWDENFVWTEDGVTVSEETFTGEIET